MNTDYLYMVVGVYRENQEAAKKKKKRLTIGFI